MPGESEYVCQTLRAMSTELWGSSKNRKRGCQGNAERCGASETHASRCLRAAASSVQNVSPGTPVLVRACEFVCLWGSSLEISKWDLCVSSGSVLQEFSQGRFS